MKPVLIQTLMKNRQRKRVAVDPSVTDLKKANDGIFVFIVFALAVIVIGSISIGA